jgi:hypothetical protein
MSKTLVSMVKTTVFISDIVIGPNYDKHRNRQALKEGSAKAENHGPDHRWGHYRLPGKGL